MKTLIDFNLTSKTLPGAVGGFIYMMMILLVYASIGWSVLCLILSFVTWQFHFFIPWVLLRVVIIAFAGLSAMFAYDIYRGKE